MTEKKIGMSGKGQKINKCLEKPRSELLVGTTRGIIDIQTDK